MTQIRESDYLQSLAGRTVALVGAAASATGSRLGAEIGGHDVVVRVNWGAPVPRALVGDLGVRTDVLYHLLMYARRPVQPRDVQRWAGRVGCVIAVHPPHVARVRRFGPLAAAHQLPWFALKTLRGDLKAQLGTTPNTGILALAHLLSSRLDRLSLYGMDFYTTGHWLGQRNETPAQAAAQAGIITGHDQPTQRAYVARLLRTDNRLVVTPYLRGILEQEAG